VSDTSARTRPQSGAGHNQVADTERAPLHQHGGDRAAAAIELGFDHGAFGRPVRVGLEIEDFRLQGRCFEQLSMLSSWSRTPRCRAPGRRATRPGSRAAAIGAHPFGLGVRPVDLVDRHDDRHLRSLGVVNRLTVCGMTPSSAATTSTTMSVTLAPRARIAVKAAWPGVSMKVILLPEGAVTW
jgi:hypothetical protein